MSKELQALEALNNIKNLFIGSPINPAQQFEIIETALKDYEHSQQQRELYFKQAKELKSIELDNKKKLKALEIIKKKILDMDYFNIIADRCNLTYQEYNLLKEVLK